MNKDYTHKVESSDIELRFNDTMQSEFFHSLHYVGDNMFNTLEGVIELTDSEILDLATNKIHHADDYDIIMLTK